MSVLVRRAQPWLGTLVEIGVKTEEGRVPDANRAIQRAFDLIGEAQSVLSRFDVGSDVSHFNAAPAGEHFKIRPHAVAVLRMAQRLHEQTGGAFDIALGSGRWYITPDEYWVKVDGATQVDLGGIAKGHAVDVAFDALNCGTWDALWINAGGDLRVRGMPLPVELRDEVSGGVRSWGVVTTAALATSYFGPTARSCLYGRQRACHVSVMASSCMVADALTKVLAILGPEKAQPVLDVYLAEGWIHA